MQGERSGGVVVEGRAVFAVPRGPCRAGYGARLGEADLEDTGDG